MQQQIRQIMDQIGQVIVGKDDVACAIIRTILAGGHILLDDVPGVGKTTLAVALSRSVGFSYRRIQFTPDVLPSDIVGFSVYDRQAGTLSYQPGALDQVNLLLGDEINRTSSRTQSALLQAMEERQVTVDGVTRPLADPFIVIATQNQVGTAGTQQLPYAQMERFMVRLSVGQPDQQALMRLLRDRQTEDPLDRIKAVVSCEEIRDMQIRVRQVTVKDSVLDYISRLVLATREHPELDQGLSPRAALHLSRSTQAAAFMDDRDYVTGEDVQKVFGDVCTHRLLIHRTASRDTTPQQVIRQLIHTVPTSDHGA